MSQRRHKQVRVRGIVKEVTLHKTESSAYLSLNKPNLTYNSLSLYNPESKIKTTLRLKENAMSDKAIANTSYKTLVKTLKQEIKDTGEKLKQTIETEKVSVYWRMGKHIHTHLLEHKERAEYGKELFPRLESEINISQALLRRMVQFYKEFPKYAARRELSWTHYKELLPVKDREKRREYIDKIKEDSLSVRELREHRLLSRFLDF